MVKQICKNLRDIVNGKDFIIYKGLHFPQSRSNETLSDNEEYLRSGLHQVEFLSYNELISNKNNKTRVLDFGCGQGSLFNVLQYSETKFDSYFGIYIRKVE